ncbi:MAG: hypothetical protein ACYTDV_17205 [Planctomycetota bacterium]
MHGVTTGRQWPAVLAQVLGRDSTQVDLMTMPEALKDIRKEFEDYAKSHPYESFLPADAKPPVDINEKLMNEYRPLMEAFYTEQQ